MTPDDMTNEELNSRVKNAIILLSDGYPMTVGDLIFGSKDNKHFSVAGVTLKNNLEDLTKRYALSELEEVRGLFSNMLNASKELAEFIKDKQIDYCLIYDYGMGSLEICREIDGQINWEMDIRE